MIPRYSRSEMVSIWTEDAKLKHWFDIELAAVEGWARIGVVPKEAADHIRAKAVLDAARVAEIEAITRHDVAAFVQSLEESVGEEYGRWIHFGMTSSDVLDTALGIQLRDAADLLLKGIDAILDVLKLRAYEHRDTPMIGRSHGIHAEPTTAGHVFAMWYDEMRRNRARLWEARTQIAVGKVSGAVGNFTHIPMEVEDYVCEALGLKPELAATQVVSRDRHAHYFSTLGIIASSLEKFAVQVRHWQRTEVGEAEEKFHAGQKGSSAMPHKRNPVLTENVTGLARVVRGYVMPALENVALWHERDISHSSVERMIGPDATITLDFALHRMTGVLRDLVIYPERMMANLERTGGLPFSQGLLLALIRKGLSRQAAYGRVQVVAMRAFESGTAFEPMAIQAAELREVLSEDEIRQAFDLQTVLGRIPDMFERVFNT